MNGKNFKGERGGGGKEKKMRKGGERMRRAKGEEMEGGRKIYQAFS